MVEFGLDRAAEVLTRGFADYFVAIPFSAAGLLQMARGDSVDYATSRVAVCDGAAAGAALIARRGWTSRLAGMALVPEARRRGAGRALVNHLLVEAKARSERAMVLEVIEQNEAAVRLYESCGFRKRRRLVGLAAKPAGAAAIPTALAEIDLRELASGITGADLPWQVSAETAATLTPPTLGFQLNNSAVAVTRTAAGQMVIRALATARTPASIREATQLLVALRAAFPESGCEIKAVWPEEMSDIFVGAGFTRTPLTQWQMEIQF